MLVGKSKTLELHRADFTYDMIRIDVVQDLMTPEDASRMAQALYDAADPVCR